MTKARIALIALLGFAVGCSSKKSAVTPQPEAGAPADASDDTATEDVFGGGQEQDTAGPTIHDGGFPLDDGSTPCDQLEATVVMLQGAAQACRTGAPQQCTGQAAGTCCPIAVSTGADPGAVADFEQAVQEYAAKCSPKCALPMCPPVVSVCTAGGTCQ